MASNPRRSPPVTRSMVVLQTNLKKGASFHSPPSSPETFSPPSLPRRSHTSLDDVVDAHRRRVALAISQIDKTLGSTSAKPKPVKFRDASLPLPRGVLLHTLDTSIAPRPAPRRVLRPRSRVHHHDSDSGLGTSLESVEHKVKAAVKTTTTTTAVTRSAAATTTLSGARLSSRATNRIVEHTLKPLLAQPAFQDFHPVVLECPKKIQDKEIVCLRDVEKMLLLVAPQRTKIAGLYLDFCLTTIRCIQATVEYLGDREQTRPRDLPYTSGYFIDLVDQIEEYARQLADARDGDSKDFDPSDEIKLHGGIHVNGRPAELVRVKKSGKVISMATGEVLEEVEEDAGAHPKIKRSASEEAEVEEEILRSMARRKKNASPEELAPKRCREPGCTKEFKRPCDLTKHEKTHSRPWKCPVSSCKYHEYGWPTEKEMDRHHNDKHSAAPPMYTCLYKPCPYKSKRESNCKQHMEKAHGWQYVRTKTNGKKDSNSGSVSGMDLGMQMQQQPLLQPYHQMSPQQVTPQLHNMPTPSSEHSVGTPPQGIDAYARLYDAGLDFPAYLSHDAGFDIVPQEISLDYSPMDDSPLSGTPESGSGGWDQLSAASSLHGASGGNYQDVTNNDFTLYEDIYSANVHVPAVPANVIYQQHQQQQHQQQQQQQKQYPVAYPTASDYCGVAAQLSVSVPTVVTPGQLSPTGHGDAVLYTPTSMAGDHQEPYDARSNAADFVLYPNGEMAKTLPPSSEGLYTDPLFVAEVPSLAAGYSQPDSQALLNALGQLGAWPPVGAGSQYSQGYVQ